MRISIFIIFLFFFTGILSGQSINFDRLTTEDGLSNNMIHCMIQDHYGFLWIGTNNGLNKYDGYEFVEFNTGKDNGRNLTNEIVYALYEDRDSNIWIGTRKGLNRYNYLTGEIDHFLYSADDSLSIISDYILEIYQDRLGDIWIGTRGGISRMISTGHFINYKIEDKGIKSIYEDQFGVLWIGNEYGEILKYNRKKDTFVKIAEIEHEINSTENPVWFIKEDGKGQLIAGMTNGLFKIDRNSEDYSVYVKRTGQPSGFRNNEIRCVFFEGKKLWLGTWGRGLHILDLENNTWQNYVKEPDNPYSISNNDINTIFRDRSGVTWIATQDGLDKIDPAKDLFIHHQNDPSEKNSLTLNYITGFSEMANGEIWIATFGGGINILKNGRFRHIVHNPESNNSLIDNAIRVIAQDVEGNMWIGTRSGLDRYEPKKNKFTHFLHDPEDKNSLSGNDIMSILADSRDNIWIGTYGDGLNMYNTRTKKFTRYLANEHSSKSISCNYIREIYEDSKGNIWIGFVENGGINVYNPNDGVFSRIKKDPRSENSLVDNNINSIYEDNSGNIWIATWSGMNMYNPENESFQLYTTSDGLLSNKIAEIVQDNHGNFWVSSHMGFSKFNPKKKIFINYTLSSGVQGNEFNVNASLISSEGEIYFGGTNGFNIIDPDEVYENPFVPPVVFTDFQINNKSVRPGKKSRLKKALNETDEIVLKYKDNIVSFAFSGLSYSLSHRNKYAYMMEGVDNDWVQRDSRLRYASYTNLKPGEYVFMVKASNNDMQWNDEVRTIKITMLPPPWKTSWAIMIYGIITLLVLLLLRRFVLMSERFRNELVLAKVEKDKVEEINQMKLRFFTNISHEFKTPLSLILAPLEELLNEDKPDWDIAKNHLNLMQRNGNRLLRLINQLMEFRRLEQGNGQLKVKNGDIVTFLQDIRDAFSELAEKKKIKFQLNSSREHLEIWYDYDKLEKIFYNLISNAIKFTNEGGKIEIDIHVPDKIEASQNNRLQQKLMIFNPKMMANRSSSRFIEIKITDNGVGIPEENMHKIFDRFFQFEKEVFSRGKKISMAGTGIGLALTKSLIDLHKGRISVESQVGEGTVFTIKLPLGKEAYSDDEIVIDDGPETEKKLDEYLSDDISEANCDEETEHAELFRQKNLPVILIVEDNGDLRKFLKNNLEEKYLIKEAAHGKEGFDLAKTIVPDLIITDIMMPVMDGIEMSKLIKADELTRHIPLIMLTAKESLDDKIEGIETGADDYMGKPFSLRLLTAKIKNLIEQRSKIQEELKKKILLEPKDILLDSPDEIFLRKAVEIIENNISDPEFGVDQFGTDMNLSRMQLYRKLKALTNQSANEFIRSVRLKRAAQMLKQTNSYTIAEITYEVGFNDPKYFSKCFQKEFGVTPSKFINCG